MTSISSHKSAICASKDWSIVNKLFVSSFVTPQIAEQKMFSKVLIKTHLWQVQAWKQLCQHLVQDRSTGLVMEEKMSVTVRLGFDFFIRVSIKLKVEESVHYCED